MQAEKWRHAEDCHGAWCADRLCGCDCGLDRFINMLELGLVAVSREGVEGRLEPLGVDKPTRKLARSLGAEPGYRIVQPDGDTDG
jgi:hypothetical protein